MSKSRLLLKLGAYCNFGIALLHLMFIVAREKELRYFGAPIWVLDLHRERRGAFVLLLIGMACVFVLVALYAFSGVGSIRRLPLLRTCLVVIGAIFALRGLLVIAEVIIIVRRYSGDYLQYVHFPVMSLFALCVGFFYLAGAAGNWSSLKPVRE